MQMLTRSGWSPSNDIEVFFEVTSIIIAISHYNYYHYYQIHTYQSQRFYYEKIMFNSCGIINVR